MAAAVIALFLSAPFFVDPAPPGCPDLNAQCLLVDQLFPDANCGGFEIKASRPTKGNFTIGVPTRVGFPGVGLTVPDKGPDSAKGSDSADIACEPPYYYKITADYLGTVGLNHAVRATVTRMPRE